MSAINDALRRASGASKSGARPLPTMPVPGAAHHSPPPPPPPPSPVAHAHVAPAPPPPPLPPLISSVRDTDGASLEDVPAKTGSKLLAVLLILLVCGLGAGGGGYYFWKKGKLFVHAKEPPAAKEEVSDNDRVAALFGDEKAARKVAADIDEAPVPAPNKPGPVPVRKPDLAAKPAPATVASAPAPAPSPAPMPLVPVRFPPLRLQSIFYRPSNPSVIINGKTLFVTDEINGVIVADIQPASVTLVLSGQTNVLTLR